MDTGSSLTQAEPLIQPCPHCAALIDVSEQEPLSMIECPGCGKHMAVHGVVDHFELVAVAGRGGMGVVYKARDASLQRLVALKVLRKDHSDNATLIAQLETEAAITASINHPHVVKVFSTGFDRGRFYLAMELVDKGSLDDLMRIQGSVAEVQMLEVGIQIAKGLQAAHSHGLIHRDVKPGNILFADAHTAKIVDFGLAIFMDQEESVRGEIWGTPYYVAPEKLDGKPEDFRSDIYSLGATLFHAMAGRPPFEAETASLVALKHLKSEPVSLQAFAPHVSGRTAFIINRTLLKDPAARYQSYEELIEHLEYAREELVAEAGKPRQTQRVVLETSQDQRIWGWVSLAMIVLILAGAGGVYAFRDRVFEKPQETVVEPVVSESSSPLQAGRDLWIAGKPIEAAEIFRTGAKKAHNAEAATWAVLQEGLAELQTGRVNAPRTAFKNLIDRADTLSKQDDRRELAAFLGRLAVELGADSPIDPSSLEGVSKDSPQAIAFLAAGLKNWQLGKIEDAVTLFRRFREITPSGADKWLADLKPLSTQLIEETTRFQMAADQFRIARTTEDRAAAEGQLAVFKAPLNERVLKLLAETPSLEELNSVIVEGIYVISNHKTGAALDVWGESLEDRAPVKIWQVTKHSNQQWEARPVGGGAFKLVGRQSQKVLEPAGKPGAASANVQQNSWKDGAGQKWRFESLGEGLFKIVNAADGKVLGAQEQDPSVLFVGDYTETRRQQWKFEPVR